MRVGGHHGGRRPTLRPAITRGTGPNHSDLGPGLTPAGYCCVSAPGSVRRRIPPRAEKAPISATTRLHRKRPFLRTGRSATGARRAPGDRRPAPSRRPFPTDGAKPISGFGGRDNRRRARGVPGAGPSNDRSNSRRARRGSTATAHALSDARKNRARFTRPPSEC